MKQTDWPLQPEDAGDFNAVVETLRSLVGERVIVTVSDGTARSPIELHGKLGPPTEVAEPERVIFPVGSGYVALDPGSYRGASRSGDDRGDYWTVGVTQDTLTVFVGDDKDASR